MDAPERAELLDEYVRLGQVGEFAMFVHLPRALLRRMGVSHSSGPGVALTVCITFSWLVLGAIVVGAVTRPTGPLWEAWWALF